MSCQHRARPYPGALGGNTSPPCGTFFETTPEEQAVILELLESAKAHLDKEHRPNGYNIGINNGTAAGQTVMHLHVHLIQQYSGDTSDPRCGIRWTLSDKAAYWKRQ